MKDNLFNYTISLFIVIFLFMLQTSNLNPIPIVNIPVNYLVVISICISCYSKLSNRILISLLCGLFIDIWFSSCSFYTLSLIIINSLISLFSSKTKVGMLFIYLAVFVGTVTIEIVNASLLGFCLYTTVFNPFVIYKKYIITLSIGNTIFAIITFPILNYFVTVRNKRIIFDDKYEIDI